MATQNKTLCFTYSRFSSDGQKDGDSLRRQNDLVDRWMEQHPEMELSNETFTDAGVSAYRGKHAKRGAFSRFLRLVEDGHIPPNSYLLVEQFDRLSRQEPLKAITQLQSLLQEDIIVVTLNDGREYSKESMSTDGGMGLMMSCLQMIRSHEESRIKGMRVSQAWQQKFKKVDDGVMLTRRLPFWIDKNDNTKINKERALDIKRIFALSAKGYGTNSIVKELNESGIPTPTAQATHWKAGTVRKLLKSKSVIGVLVTADGVEHPNYFPQVVSEAVFSKVQTLHKSAKTIRGPINIGQRGSHPLAGIIFCSRCGDAAHYVTKYGRLRKDGTKKIYNYAICGRSMEAGTDCYYRTINYGLLVGSLVLAIRNHEYDSSAHESTNELKKLETELEHLEAQLDFMPVVRTALGRKKYIELLNQIDYLQIQIKEIRESRSPLNARIFKQAQQDIVKNLMTTNTNFRQLIQRIDIDFITGLFAIKYNDNGKAKASIHDFDDLH